MAQDTSAAQQQLQADPQFQQLVSRWKEIVQQFNATPNANGQRAPFVNPMMLAEQAIQDYAHAHGMPQGYSWNSNEGRMTEDSFANRHPYLTAGLLGGAAVVAPIAFGTVGLGGAAGAGGGSAAAGGAGAGGAGAAGAGGAGAAGAGGAGATAATTGFGAALKAALPTIIGAGASLGGAAIAAHGNTEAAKIAAAEQDKALAQAKEIYQQNVARQKPFVDIGTSALGPLAFGMGLPAPAAAEPPPSTGVAPGAVDANGKPLPGAATAPYVTPPTMAQQTSLSQLGQSGGGTTRVRNPANGQVYPIPNNQVAAAVADGGQVVS